MPGVFELRQGPLLLMPQPTAERIGTPSFSRLLTLVRGLRQYMDNTNTCQEYKYMRIQINAKHNLSYALPTRNTNKCQA